MNTIFHSFCGKARRRIRVAIACRAIASVAIILHLTAFVDPASASDELLYYTEGNRLRVLDVYSIDHPPRDESILVENASGGGRDVNGTPCFFPDGSGRFLAGEDTGQPTVTPGWGIFSRDGQQVGKLTATYQVTGAEPHGCAFRDDGVLFTSSVGTQGLGEGSGQLIMWFPPFDGYPGAPGEFPDANPKSDDYCILADDLGTAASVLIDPDDNVLVAQSGVSLVEKFSAPFPTAPNAEGGCGAISTGVDGRTSPKWSEDEVNRETLISGGLELSIFSGLALSYSTPRTLYVASNLTGKIAEYSLDGAFIRYILDHDQFAFELPKNYGTPQGIAVGRDGTLYYADLALEGSLPNPGPARNQGKIWRITFDDEGEPNAPEIIAEGDFNYPDGVAIRPPDTWSSYAGGAERRSFAPLEEIIDGDTAGELVERWEFPTAGVITGSAVVDNVFIPNEGMQQIAYFQSWDRFIYAVRVIDGSLLWSHRTDTHPGASFENAASGHTQIVAGRHMLYMGTGEILYALDAATGEEVWRFAAGTGCKDAAGNPPGLCGFTGERNQIESSPFIANGKLFFGMDINDVPRGKGGFYALHVDDGRLAWFFDLESGATCTPDPEDEIRRFDGYHSESELGLPDGFFATRDGCDHPRNKNGCGNVWSSPAVDLARALLFTASSNCDMPIDSGTGEPETMPPYDEAIFALDFEGRPVWRWRPRRADNDDLAFGGVPNLFSIEVDIEGESTEVDVVGVGNKDGTYYVLDREGVNRESGARWDDSPETHLPADLPYWSTNVVPGGDIGGVIATASVDQEARRVYLSTAPGDGAENSPTEPGAVSQQPTLHALDIDTGDLVWNNSNENVAAASFGPTFAVDGAVFFGTVPGGLLRRYRSDVAPIGPGLPGNAAPLGPPLDLGNTALAAPAIAVNGTLLVGEGIGTRAQGGSSPGDFSAAIPSDLNAFCVPGTTGCGPCNDGLDNDGDGLIDFDPFPFSGDPGCASANDSSEVRGDLDYDNRVDESDRSVFLAGFGRAPGEPGFRSAADFDGDELITFVDYQEWLQALEDFNDPPIEALGGAASATPRCGLVGLELLAALGLVRAFARRRSRPPAEATPRSVRSPFPGMLVALVSIAGFMSAETASALTTVRFGPVPDSIAVGEEFDVLVLADVDTPVIGFGFDVQYEENLLDWVGTSVVDPWMMAYGGSDGVAGLSQLAGVSGDDLLLATLTFRATEAGLGWFVVGVSDNDLTEGFPLVGSGFDEYARLPNDFITIDAPEPSTTILLLTGVIGFGLRLRRKAPA